MTKQRQSPHWHWALTGALIFVIAAFYLTTLRAGHVWGDDFAMYLRHAQNLVTGRAYADTGYIYNPAYPELSPRAYPPVLPLLFAPVYAVFGLNLTVFKWVSTFALLLALCVIDRALRSTLRWPERLTVLALVGFNPFFWDYKDTIASEFTFLLFVVVSLWPIHLAYRQPGPVRWRTLVGISLALYLVVGTRTIGLTLILALWVYELFFARQPGRLAWKVTALVAAPLLIQALLIPGGSSYLDQLNITPVGVADNAISLAKALANFVDNGYSQVGQVALFGLVSALAAMGGWRRWRSGLNVWDVALGFYGLVTLLWPEAYWGRRFLIPIIPLYFYYMLIGARWLAERWPRLKNAAALAAMLIGLAYVARYTQADFGPLRAGIADPETVALFDHIRRNTSPEAVFIFQKPRALALYTHRSASAYAKEADDVTLWQYFRAIQANYLIVAREFKDDQGVLAPWVARQAQGLELVYTNADFQLYQITAASP